MSFPYQEKSVDVVTLMARIPEDPHENIRVTLRCVSYDILVSPQLFSTIAACAQTTLAFVDSFGPKEHNAQAVYASSFIDNLSAYIL